MKRFLFSWQEQNIKVITTEVLIVGSGIAGLYTALKAADHYKVMILTKKDIQESNTEHAQGGIAAAMDEADSPDLHFEDTLKAGAGICDSEAVKILVEEGPERVSELIKMGAHFDRQGNLLKFTREGAHSRRRIIHARGDATGEEVERTLVSQVRNSQSIEVREKHLVTDLLTDKWGKVIGVLSLNTLTGELEGYLAGAVILATGGLGQIYRYTTNPEVATGDGIAAAYRAGASLMDMEFIQFHPTALLLPGAPRFLISEAVRGEGAYLINQDGIRFMKDFPDKELAPRDVVARAIWKEMNNGGQVYLDFRPIGREKILEQFPTIYHTCLKYGVDVTMAPVPIAPAVHYLMGGIRTNTHGETNIKNLYAVGECACNGVHGANRLASNSLLDGLVYGAKIVERLRTADLELPVWEEVYRSPDDKLPVLGEHQNPIALKEALKDAMWEKVGILRIEDSLAEAVTFLGFVEENFLPEIDAPEIELKNMISLALVIAKAALSRKESRGAHFRSDFPDQDNNEWKKHSVQNKEDADVNFISI